MNFREELSKAVLKDVPAVGAVAPADKKNALVIVGIPCRMEDTQTEFDIDLPPGPIVSIELSMEESTIKLTGGKQRARVVPLIFFQIDPRAEKVHRAFFWLPVGMRVDTDYDFDLVGKIAIPHPAQMTIMALYEKRLSAEERANVRKP